MKKLVIAFLFLSFTMSAQDMKVVSGDFKFLKDQKEINVEFDYSKFTMMKEKKTEAQYVAEHKADLDKKTKGTGDIWQKKWNSAKELIWTPKFLELMHIIFTKDKKEVSFGSIHIVVGKY